MYYGYEPWGDDFYGDGMYGYCAGYPYYGHGCGHGGGCGYRHRHHRYPHRRRRYW